jgi:hypothetical protein
MIVILTFIENLIIIYHEASFFTSYCLSTKLLLYSYLRTKVPLGIREEDSVSSRE